MWCCRCFCPQESDEERFGEQLLDGEQGLAAPKMDHSVLYSCPVITEPREGLSFYIRGRVLKTCERFSINLVLGNQQRDVALHFNPRLPQNYVVRNSKIGGHWGDEERTSCLPFSLHRDSHFLIQILVTHHSYLISINGRHFANYEHRVPYKFVKTLEVKGDVADVSCEQSMISEYPQPAAEVKQILYVDDNDIQLSPESRFPVPYYGKLKMPFDNGHVLHLTGRLKILPHSFYVNLQGGSKIWPHPMIHFHFNPRFASIGGKHVLCCNSWLEADWATEERVEMTYSDFYPGNKFKLRFQRTYSGYQVYLNDHLINDFSFRDKGQLKPDTVYVEGDFVISEIYVSNSYEEYPVEED